jgi:hypothetical protein
MSVARFRRSASMNSGRVPNGSPETWRAPDGIPPGALSSRQPAYKPGFGWLADKSANVTAIPLGRRLPGASSNLPGWPVWTQTSKLPCLRPKTSRHPYSVLLPVGFAVPPTLPPTRCALTAPFHPYRVFPRGRTRRSVLCGTIPGLAPAGCYPAPLVHGARTFLPGPLPAPPRKRGRKVGVPERPSGRLTKDG